MKSAGSGSMNGFFFGLLDALLSESLETFCSFWGVGFFASDGQNLSWNYGSISIEIGSGIKGAKSSAFTKTSDERRNKGLAGCYVHGHLEDNARPVLISHLPLTFLQVGAMLHSPLDALQRYTKAWTTLHTGTWDFVWMMASSEGANTRSSDAFADWYLLATSSASVVGKSLNILERPEIVSTMALAWLVVVHTANLLLLLMLVRFEAALVGNETWRSSKKTMRDVDSTLSNNKINWTIGRKRYLVIESLE
jgi:hypothetical protein